MLSGLRRSLRRKLLPSQGHELSSWRRSRLAVSRRAVSSSGLSSSLRSEPNGPAASALTRSSGELKHIAFGLDTDGQAGNTLVTVRGTTESLKHVEVGLATLRAEDLGRDLAMTRFRVEGEPPTALIPFLELMQDVLATHPPTGMDLCLALDYYSRSEDAGPRARSDVGAEVYLAKYRSGRQAEHALVRLADTLCAAITAHPVYAQVDLITAPPGHLGDGKSFGERLARETARYARKKYVPAKGKTARPAMKAGVKLDLSQSFSFDQPLSGSVIVIDDVYGTGSSMSGTALAARRAGAPTVFGIVAAKK